MKFLYPQFLWALGALSIPLLIHLFNFRRYTTVYFSNTRFLQNVVKQSKSINRLRQILIMLARMLALTCLVLAFANPYIPSSNPAAANGNFASVYVDNSPSMLSGEDQNTLLNMARDKAVEIIKGLPENYRIQILTNDFQGRQERFYSKGEAIDMVDAITPSYAFRQSSDIMARIKQAQEKNDDQPLEVFWISDFQSSAFSQKLSPPSNWQQTLLPLRAPQNIGNISIDSVWFDKPVLQPGFDQDLMVQIGNSGSDESRKVSVSLKLDGQLQGAKAVEIPAGRKTTTLFTLRAAKAAVYSGEISLDAGNPYFDNQFYFSYSVARPFHILITGDDQFNSRFKKLFADSIYQTDFTGLDQTNYTELPNYDLIILNAPASVPGGFTQALKENLNQGKNVVLIPSSDDEEAINTVLANLGLASLGAKGGKIRAMDVSWNDPHFKGVFNSTPEKPALPNADEHFQYSNSIGYPLITLEDGNPMVSRIPVGTGNLFLFTTPLAKSDIISHPIFVPLMLNTALYSRHSSALYTLSGKARGPEFEITQSSESPLQIELPNASPIIPRQRNRNHTIELYDLPPELKPGIYPVSLNNNRLGSLALNIPAEESRWNFLDDNAILSNFGLASKNILEAETADLGFTIGQRYQGTPLWKWFLAGALFFLIVEIILIKLWK